MRKCRILSIGVIAISIILLVIGVLVVINKNNNRVIYATSIKFNGLVHGAEICIDNKLIVNSNLITVEPANVTVTPQFVIKKSGEDDEIAITGESYEFTSTGKYTLSCKIQSNKKFYLYDSITLTVVDTPTETTNVYINQTSNLILYEQNTAPISSVVETICPENSQLIYKHSEHISLNNGIITAIKSGLATLDITVHYDNIIISKQILIIVRPKIVETEISLKLTVGSTNIDDNVINISNAGFNVAINYELLHTDNQLINCWTDSNIINVVSFNAPTIVVKPINVGIATIYISPIDHPNKIFEITINVS